MLATGLILSTVLLSAPPQVASELLPKALPDWRYERLEFPLAFAPELKYDGFEELLFAPGMFNERSDTYFTYIFAIKITNEAKFDAASLKSFLEKYYKGLCRSVAEGTEFDIDVSKVSADVREDHYEAKDLRHFTATLDSFDPFVTGGPLKLNMEIILHQPSSTDHRIFAAVSPKPLESAVWKILRKLKAQFRKHAGNSTKK